MGMTIFLIALGLIYFGVAGWVAVWAAFEREWGISVICALLVLAGIGGAMAMSEEAQSDHYLLPVNEWSCTDTDIVVMPILVGKVIVNQTHTVCVEYRRS